nr:putative 21.2 kda protein [Quercus suber]
MADPYEYTYPSPLEGYTGLAPLSQEQHTSGPHAKSFIDLPTSTLSAAYEQFPDPISNGDRGGFDVHIYFQHTNAYETKYATELHERVRRESPRPTPRGHVRSEPVHACAIRRLRRVAGHPPRPAQRTGASQHARGVPRPHAACDLVGTAVSPASGYVTQA